jgi:hypothetical protein
VASAARGLVPGESRLVFQSAFMVAGGPEQRGAGRRRGCGQQMVQIPGAANGKGHRVSPCGLHGCGGGQSNAAPAGAVVAASRWFKSQGRERKRPPGFTLWPSWLRGGDLNPRPLGYEPNELPDCSTPRHRGAPRHRTTQRYHASRARSNCRRVAAGLPGPGMVATDAAAPGAIASRPGAGRRG